MSSAPRILLVDDDPIMRELASERLRNASYEVALAENGAEALEALRRDGADLVISDLEMPVMDGFELTENIRADRTIAETPVIVVTASDHADAVDRAFGAGATSFLAKPINWTLFSQAVMFVLRASEDQQALRAARDQAEAGAKFKDGLMSIMSHELRTPLNAIIGFGQLLGERFEQEHDIVHKEYADYIVDGGKRLLNNISDMLLASDARSGPIAINEVDTTIGDVLEDAQTLTANVLRASGAELTLRIQDPGLEICADKTLLARAISKLLDNAVKFSKRDVKILVASALTKKGDLAVLIKDNGPGIPANKLREASAPFEQSDMSLKRSKEGLGLGLPLAQAISQAHQARLQLTSKPNEGTQALVVIPAARINNARQTSRRSVA